jgi:succinate dehydrogenase / fumarate reductase cytochrome b subunit
MINTDRPLSPHLSVYRWPITMVLSILHRMTGVAMAFGLILFALWLSRLAAGPEPYGAFVAAMTTIPGRLLLMAWSFAFFFHLGNGVRHLFWDAGYGFEKSQANASAWVVVAAAVVVTAVFWVLL